MNTANFYCARELAEIQNMDIDYMALTQSLAHYAEEMRRFAEANDLYSALAEKSESSNHWEAAASACHQLGIIAQEQRDFSQAVEFYLKSIKMLANANDTHSLMIAIRNYAGLLHAVEGTEYSQLKQAWSACMAKELTEILEGMEVELNNADS